jgi:hypothetical protein
MVTNLILNALMLISGAGMLALRGWARKLAIGVAWAKIFRLVMLTASAFLVVAPVVSNMMSRAMTAGEEMAVKAAEEAAALEEATTKPVEEVPTFEPVPVHGEGPQKEHADQPNEKGEGEAPPKTSGPPPNEGENPTATSNVQTSVRSGGVQVNVTSGQFTPQMRAEMENAARGVGLAFGVYSAGMLVLGIIYPIVSIILLNRKAVKAAFIAPREYA